MHLFIHRKAPALPFADDKVFLFSVRGSTVYPSKVFLFPKKL